jgi:HAD superfamily hydrolase (TIGR01549 family)
MYQEIARQCGKTLTIDELNYCYEHSMNDNVQHIFQEDVWDIIKNLDYKRFYNMVMPEPDIAHTLDTLTHMGIKVSICSNRVSGIAYILDRFNLSRFIDNVVTSKDYPSKPDPTGLLSLIDDTAVFVGDGEIDRQTALNAGIPFIAYNNPNIPAVKHIKSHLQILSLTNDIRSGNIDIKGASVEQDVTIQSGGVN